MDGSRLSQVQDKRDESPLLCPPVQLLSACEIRLSWYGPAYCIAWSSITHLPCRELTRIAQDYDHQLSPLPMILVLCEFNAVLLDSRCNCLEYPLTVVPILVTDRLDAKMTVNDRFQMFGSKVGPVSPKWTAPVCHKFRTSETNLLFYALQYSH